MHIYICISDFIHASGINSMLIICTMEETKVERVIGSECVLLERLQVKNVWSEMIFCDRFIVLCKVLSI